MAARSSTFFVSCRWIYSRFEQNVPRKRFRWYKSGLLMRFVSRKRFRWYIMDIREPNRQAWSCQAVGLVRSGAPKFAPQVPPPGLSPLLSVQVNDFVQKFFHSCNPRIHRHLK